MPIFETPIDLLLGAIYDASFQAMLDVQPHALATISVLFTIHLAWRIGLWVISDRQEFLQQIILHVAIFIFAFFGLSTAPAWLPTIPEHFEYVGKLTTGVDGLRPEAFLGLATDLSRAFGGVIGNYLEMFDLFFLPFRMTSILWLMFAFALIAWKIAHVQLETAFHMGGLMYFLAFAGHPFTWGLFSGYFRSIFSLSTRILVLYLLLGVAYHLGNLWLEGFQTAQVLAFDEYLTVLVSVPLLTHLVWTVPDKIAAAITGNWSLPNPYN